MAKIFKIRGYLIDTDESRNRVQALSMKDGNLHPDDGKLKASRMNTVKTQRRVCTAKITHGWSTGFGDVFNAKTNDTA